MGNKDIANYLRIGEKIKNIRIKKGWTQKEFAKKLGIPSSSYSNYENGNRAPTADTILKIADALGVSASYLMGWEDESNTDKASKDKPNSPTPSEILENIKKGKTNKAIIIMGSGGPGGQDVINIDDDEYAAIKAVLEAMRNAKQKERHIATNEDDKAYIQIAAYGGKGVELHPYDKKDQEEIDALFDEIDREERLNDFRNRKKDKNSDK